MCCLCVSYTVTQTKKFSWWEHMLSCHKWQYNGDDAIGPVTVLEDTTYLENMGDFLKAICIRLVCSGLQLLFQHCSDRLMPIPCRLQVGKSITRCCDGRDLHALKVLSTSGPHSSLAYTEEFLQQKESAVQHQDKVFYLSLKAIWFLCCFRTSGATCYELCNNTFQKFLKRPL